MAQNDLHHWTSPAKHRQPIRQFAWGLCPARRRLRFRGLFARLSGRNHQVDGGSPAGGVEAQRGTGCGGFPFLADPGIGCLTWHSSGQSESSAGARRLHLQSCTPGAVSRPFWLLTFSRESTRQPTPFSILAPKTPCHPWIPPWIMGNRGPTEPPTPHVAHSCLHIREAAPEPCRLLPLPRFVCSASVESRGRRRRRLFLPPSSCCGLSSPSLASDLCGAAHTPIRLLPS
ncbi:hypothetical protein QBC39DRAFT_27911 [Podospora conica]|nr:hypothetical protein QBC39DRAFT_27911 [Schizothecium conicum]